MLLKKRDIMAAAFPAGNPDKEDDKELGCVENKDDVDEFCIGKKDSIRKGV